MTFASNESSLESRVGGLDWVSLADLLDSRGFAVTDQLLGSRECEELADLFDEGRFRSTIDMARHRFGDGRYRYFDHPLPEAIAELRTSFYCHLAPIANDWSRPCAARSSIRSSTRSCSSCAVPQARSARRR
jgi:hypothetical protein